MIRRVNSLEGFVSRPVTSRSQGCYLSTYRWPREGNEKLWWWWLRFKTKVGARDHQCRVDGCAGQRTMEHSDSLREKLFVYRKFSKYINSSAWDLRFSRLWTWPLFWTVTPCRLVDKISTLWKNILSPSLALKMETVCFFRSFDFFPTILHAVITQNNMATLTPRFTKWYVPSDFFVQR